MTRTELLQRLAEQRDWLAARGIGRVRLFGSYARDQAKPGSDVDLPVDALRPMGWEFFGIEDDLSTRLGLKVSMHTEGDLHRIVLRNVLADAVDA